MELTGRKSDDLQMEKRMQAASLNDNGPAASVLSSGIALGGPSSGLRSAAYKVPNNCPSVKT